MKKKPIAFLLCVLMLLPLVPASVFAAAKTPITKIQVTNVPTPVAGASTGTSGIKITSTPANAFTVKEIYWEYGAWNDRETGATFRPGTEYALCVVLLAKSGYIFSYDHEEGFYNGTATFNGIKTYYSDSDGEELTIGSQSMQVGYPSTWKPVTRVEVTGFRLPITGASTDLSGLKIVSSPADAVNVVSVHWYNSKTNSHTDKTFGEEGWYLLNLELEPKNGFYFARGGVDNQQYAGTVTIYGDPPGFINFTEKGGINLGSASYTAGYIDINSVTIDGVPMPIIGKPTDTSGITFETTPTDAIASCELKWFNATDDTYDDAVFKAGCQYQLCADIDAKTGFVFPDYHGEYPGTLIVDGKAAKKYSLPLDSKYTSYGSPFISLWSEDYTPVEALPSGQITRVIVSGVKPPVAYASTAINKSDLTITSVPKNACRIGNVYWYNKTNDTKDDSIFQPDCEYYLYFTLIAANSKCIFIAAGPTSTQLTYTGTVTVNGAKVREAIKPKRTVEALVVESAMFMPSYDQITNISVSNVPTPARGASTDVSGIRITSVPEDAFTVSEIYWHNESSGSRSDKTFQDGQYRLSVSLSAKDGYYFEKPDAGTDSYSGTVKINGAPVGYMHLYSSGTGIQIYSETATIGCSHADTKQVGAVAATCTTDGFSGDTVCMECGKTVRTGVKIPKTGHTESDWIIDKAAVPGAEGLKHKVCTVCHTTLKTETIPALTAECTHTNTEVRNAVKEKCTTDGYTGDTVCKDCGKTVTVGEKIPAYGHDFHNGVCAYCGEKDPDYKPAETEPTETEPVGTDPIETEPTETEPTETEPTETEPTETEPTETEPTETEPTETEPVGSDPIETEPTETEPSETEPNGTDPTATDPVGTDAHGTEPAGKTEKASSLWWLWIVAAFLVGGGVFAVMKIKNKEN